MNSNPFNFIATFRLIGPKSKVIEKLLTILNESVVKFSYVSSGMKNEL